MTELLVTLDKPKAPELCEKLGDLYQFINGRLISAVTTHNAIAAREAERVFAPLVEGFQGAVVQVQAAQVGSAR